MEQVDWRSKTNAYASSQYKQTAGSRNEKERKNTHRCREAEIETQTERARESEFDKMRDERWREREKYEESKSSTMAQKGGGRGAKPSHQNIKPRTKESRFSEFKLLFVIYTYSLCFFFPSLSIEIRSAYTQPHTVQPTPFKYLYFFLSFSPCLCCQTLDYMYTHKIEIKWCAHDIFILSFWEKEEKYEIRNELTIW